MLWEPRTGDLILPQELWRVRRGAVLFKPKPEGWVGVSGFGAGGNRGPSVFPRPEAGGRAGVWSGGPGQSWEAMLERRKGQHPQGPVGRVTPCRTRAVRGRAVEDP